MHAAYLGELISASCTEVDPEDLGVAFRRVDVCRRVLQSIINIEYNHGSTLAIGRDLHGARLVEGGDGTTSKAMLSLLPLKNCIGMYKDSSCDQSFSMTVMLTPPAREIPVITCMLTRDMPFPPPPAPPASPPAPPPGYLVDPNLCYLGGLAHYVISPTKEVASLHMWEINVHLNDWLPGLRLVLDFPGAVQASRPLHVQAVTPREVARLLSVTRHSAILELQATAARDFKVQGLGDVKEIVVVCEVGDARPPPPPPPTSPSCPPSPKPSPPLPRDDVYLYSDDLPEVLSDTPDVKVQREKHHHNADVEIQGGFSEGEAPQPPPPPTPLKHTEDNAGFYITAFLVLGVAGNFIAYKVMPKAYMRKVAIAARAVRQKANATPQGKRLLLTSYGKALLQIEMRYLGMEARVAPKASLLPTADPDDDDDPGEEVDVDDDDEESTVSSRRKGAHMEDQEGSADSQEDESMSEFGGRSSCGSHSERGGRSSCGSHSERDGCSSCGLHEDESLSDFGGTRSPQSHGGSRCSCGAPSERTGRSSAGSDSESNPASELGDRSSCSSHSKRGGRSSCGSRSERDGRSEDESLSDFGGTRSSCTSQSHGGGRSSCGAHSERTGRSSCDDGSDVEDESLSDFGNRSSCGSHSERGGRSSSGLRSSDESLSDFGVRSDCSGRSDTRSRSSCGSEYSTKPSTKVIIQAGGASTKRSVSLDGVRDLAGLQRKVTKICSDAGVDIKAGLKMQYLDESGTLVYVSKSTSMRSIREARELHLITKSTRSSSRASGASHTSGASRASRALGPITEI